MRVLTLLVICVALSIALVMGIQLAAGGTAEVPEMSDAAGDTAYPYCNEYLDLTAAWIDNEDADSFDVHLALAKWTGELAEGAGYAVQFTHQGVQWGIIGFYSPAVEDGWAFWTGQATLATVAETEDAPGAFDAATSTLTITFPKSLFPHGDTSDTTLRDFTAMAADVRPAYPFILGGDTPAETNPDGHWIVCDEAASTATYAFAAGHGSDHAEHDATDATADAQSAPTPSTPPVASERAGATSEPPKETPFPTGLALALALALALVTPAGRRRTRARRRR